MTKELTSHNQKELFEILQLRFEKNTQLHEDLEWTNLESKLMANPKKLWSLHQMEITGGEPDVVGYDKRTNEYTFIDCASESPKDRRSLCYDSQALHARKQNIPRGSALEMATQMGIELLSEEQYRNLQHLGDFDTKTSSWLKTPTEIRTLGGAIFGDCRYGNVFVYHNGADSYYAARGFRGALTI